MAVNRSQAGEQAREQGRAPPRGPSGGKRPDKGSGGDPAPAPKGPAPTRGGGGAAAKVPPPEPASAPPAAPRPNIAAAVGEPDDLTRIKGIGPKLSELCQSLGITRFDQIAAWTAADIAEVDQYLKVKGRIARDDWVGQARLLAAHADTGG